MGLLDLFDSDKRSKTELREEIRRRDDQLASVQLHLAASELSQQGLADRVAKLTQDLAGLRAESEEQIEEHSRTIKALSCKASELAGRVHTERKRSRAILKCWRRPKTEPLLRVVPTQN